MSPDALNGMILVLCGYALMAIIRRVRDKNGEAEFPAEVVSGGGLLSGLLKGSRQDKPTIANLNARITELEQERDTAREQKGAEQAAFTAEIKKLQDQINELKAANLKSIAATETALRERDDARGKHINLLGKYSESLETINSMSNELNDLEIKVEALTIESKAHKSMEVLVNEFGKLLVPALIAAVKDALHVTGEMKKVITGENST